PERFIAAFGQEAGTQFYSYWMTFCAVHDEVQAHLSVLSEEEKGWLREHYDAFFFGEKPIENEYDFFTTDSKMPLKFFEMASRINLAALASSSRKLCLIADDLYRNRLKLTQKPLEQDFIWKENNLTFIISSKEHATHTQSADFFIDLGGNNTFYTNAGGTEGIRPVALHIDLNGHNEYYGNNFIQGSGFLGVGVLASFSGHNHYKASNYSQACGFFGVGIMMNSEGHNYFDLDFAGQSCALFGSTLLWNKGGDNQYKALSGMAQAASSTLGIAFLIDDKGHSRYQAGSLGKGGLKNGGIGQGGSIGVRPENWYRNPSFYGGLSFLYTAGGNNCFINPWLGQGSAYFLSAGFLIGAGQSDSFIADFDAQGQGLHLSAGLLLKTAGGNDHYKGGWGSLGVAGDRSVGMCINTGGGCSYEGTDQSVGSSRKDKALGVCMVMRGFNRFQFQKTSNTNIQMPEKPTVWPRALFIALDTHNTSSHNSYPQDIDGMKRGNNLRWGCRRHSIGIDTTLHETDVASQIFATLPQTARAPFTFDLEKGWDSNRAYLPLQVACSTDELKAQMDEIPNADYDRRRQLYECIDLLRFRKPDFAIDISPLLVNPEKISEDQLNFALLWAIQTNNNAHLNEVVHALKKELIASDYARKMAILFIGKFYNAECDLLLAQIMMTDASQENRAAAASILAIHVTAENLSLIKTGAESDSEMVRYMIAKGLQNKTSVDTMSIITHLFNDPSFYVRRAAAMTAISLHDTQGIPVLLETLHNETLDTTENYGDNIYQELSHYVGVNFGLNNDAWMKWWKQNKETFKFP
ncbi:MAG TPA: HEAT repeat domain-containing protein, partial [Chlamydiales bacterium]|nr:HEAT repeat domain-containing protein [Chlamydiales bacterium]